MSIKSHKLEHYLEFLTNTKNVKVVPVAGAVIMKKNDNGEDCILLIQRSKEDNWGMIWEFPRGKCDKGDADKLFKCLKREIKEETGLDVTPIKYIDKYEYIADNGKRRSIQYNFLCKMNNPDQKIKLSFEHDNYKWVSSFGVIELMVPPEMKKTISKVLNIDDSIVNYSFDEEIEVEE